MFDILYHKVFKQPYALKVSRIRKKQGAPLVVFLHGIGNTGAVWRETIDNLPKNVQYISLDLLGFGSSKKPDYINYDIKIHARSVIRTIKLSLMSPSKIIIVGHSLGALVAVEAAKTSPSKIDGLILCSPPFYIPPKSGSIPSRDDALKSIFKVAAENPNDFLEIANLAKKYGLVTKNFVLNKDNVRPYMSTLQSSIMSQTALQDAVSLPKRVEIEIIRGVLDPLVLQKNIKLLKKLRPSVAENTIISSHDINSRYSKAIQHSLDALLVDVD